MLKKQVSTYWLMICIILFAGQAFPAAEPKAWDAAAALALSDDLLSSAQRLVIQCRASPPNYGSGQAAGTHLEFRYHVRHFRALAVDLSTAIEESQIKARTEPIYKEMLHVMKDLEGYAIDNPRGAWIKVERAVKEAGAALGELGKFYSQ